MIKLFTTISIISTAFILTGLFSAPVFAEEIVIETQQATTTTVEYSDTQNLVEQEESIETDNSTTTELIIDTETEQATSTEPIIILSDDSETLIQDEENITAEISVIEEISEKVAEPMQIESVPEPQQPESIPDPVTSPSTVTIRVLMPDGLPPTFPVFVTFVGVGNKNFGGKIDANGGLTVIMPTGRYYTEFMIISTEYFQGEDGPSFFLEANEKRDFGAIKLMPKTNQVFQTIQDASLEADILSEVESAKGVGKILFLIVKLLIQILDEIRGIASQLAGR